MSEDQKNDNTDPHLWLEEVLGEEPLKWVGERNDHCLAQVGDVKATETYRQILGILNSKDKIPGITRIGNDGWYYNFWKDEKHVHGIWRKTTLDSYRSAEPSWQTVIDVDSLDPPTHETAKSWVWHGYRLLDEGPDGAWDRALIKLSPGGSDADTTREFDLKEEKWIDAEAEGFALPTPAKTRASYRARNELLVGTDFDGDGKTLTDSGYPRVIKSWKRGTPLSEAITVFEAEQTDISASCYAYHDRGFLHEFQSRAVTFYTSKRWYRAPQDLNVPAPDEKETFQPVPVPDDVSFSTFADAATIELRSDWSPPGREDTFAAGSLLTAPMADVMRNDWSNLVALFVPTSAASLQSNHGTKDFLVLKILEDVRTVLKFWRYDGAGVWVDMATEGDSNTEGAVAVGEDVSVSAIWPDADNSMWLWRDGFLVPDVLELANAEDGCRSTEPLKSKPAMFDSEGLTVNQYFAESADGTRIPYFVQHRADIKYDSNHPVLLGAYGGFEISSMPYYSGGVGAAWLRHGGIKVVANIRGGGEYGPRWHQAALKANRYKCYEDMEAVAQDLINRNITNPSKLACIGGSNGGLMVGNMITRPISSALFGAAVCQVPLLDMKRYSHLLAGASWMAEFGNPDTEEWSFLRKHSAYQMLRHDCIGLPEPDAKAWSVEEEAKRAQQRAAWRCPKVLFTTSTRDDRVHPGHARKMVCSLLSEASREQAPSVMYWENIEGGHGGAADNTQRAFMWALTYMFVAQSLGLPGVCDAAAEGQ